MDFTQGRFDGLCAVYSAINATYMALEKHKPPKNGMTKGEYSRWLRKQKAWSQALFNRIISDLDKRGPSVLKDRILNGANVDEMREILGICKEYVKETTDRRLLIQKKSFARLADNKAKLSDFWTHLTGLCNSEYTSVILGFEGEMEHWSCVAAIRPQFLFLSEQGPGNRIDRHRCTLSSDNKFRSLLINVRETTVLRSQKKD